jgi:hypothetical protein
MEKKNGRSKVMHKFSDTININKTQEGVIYESRLCDVGSVIVFPTMLLF